jgi:hypothetical protein
VNFVAGLWRRTRSRRDEPAYAFRRHADGRERSEERGEQRAQRDFARRDAVDEAGNQQPIRPLQFPTEGCRTPCIETDGSGCRSLGLRSACGRSSFRRSEHTFALAPHAACAGRALRTPIPTANLHPEQSVVFTGRLRWETSHCAVVHRDSDSVSTRVHPGLDVCELDHVRRPMAECLGPSRCTARDARRTIAGLRKRSCFVGFCCGPRPPAARACTPANRP